MKLVELLARELKEWPECVSITQDYDGDVGLYSISNPTKCGAERAVWRFGGHIRNIAHLSRVASDHATAIVTRTDWSAERTRIAKPAKKADKGGWIRHRGGKPPVADGVKVDYRMRNGSIDDFGRKSETLDWAHYSEIGDIMAYKLHKPAEQVEPFIEAVHAFNALAKVPQLDGPTGWRDRIAEIDATAQALSSERADLVQRLASDGFALIGFINDLLTEAAQKHEYMSNPKFWRDGDMVEILSSTNCAWKRWKGMKGRVEIEEDNMAPKIVFGCGEYWRANKNCTFRWHSRPSA